MSSADDYERHSYRSNRSNVRRNDRRVNRNYDIYSTTSYPISDPTHSSRNLEMINRPVYSNSDISVEEINRDFSPPTTTSYYKVHDDWRGSYSPVGLQSSKRFQPYEMYDYNKELRIPSKKTQEVRDRRGTQSLKRIKSRKHSLSKNEMIMAAVGGAALAVGGKELWDRKNIEKRPPQPDTLQKVALGAAGALAAYEGADIYSKRTGKDPKHAKHHRKSKRNSDTSNDSDREVRSSVKSRRSKSSRRSPHVDDEDSGGHSSSYKDRTDKGSIKKRDSDDSLVSHRRDKTSDTAAQLQKIAKTALLAGATEAFRVRNEPGGWDGDKGKRILTAAIGASAIDAVSDRKGKRHILESVIAGLASNRLINGSRHQVDDLSFDSKYSSRSRSRGRGIGYDKAGSLAALVTAGIGALAGKKHRDQSRSGSRASTSRKRRESPFSSRGRSRSSRRDDKSKRERSKSVTDFARRGLAILGLGDNSDHEKTRETSQRHRSQRHEPESDYSRRSSRYQKEFEIDSRGHTGSRYRDSPDHSMGSSNGRRRVTQNHTAMNGDRYTGRRSYDSSDSYGTVESSDNDEGYSARTKRRY